MEKKRKRMTYSKLISYAMTLVCEHWGLNLGEMGRTRLSINSFLFFCWSLKFLFFIVVQAFISYTDIQVYVAWYLLLPLPRTHGTG